MDILLTGSLHVFAGLLTSVFLRLEERADVPGAARKPEEKNTPVSNGRVFA